MLECTGATPHPLDTSPPPPLSPRACRINNAPTSVVVGSNYKATAQMAPPSNECLGSGAEDTLKERVPEIGDDLQTQGTDVSTLASIDSPIPHLTRNVVLEFGDLIGERVTRAALNRAAACGEERVDPRAVVAVERAAVAKLQNPRVVSRARWSTVCPTGPCGPVMIIHAYFFTVPSVGAHIVFRKLKHREVIKETSILYAGQGNS